MTVERVLWQKLIGFNCRIEYMVRYSLCTVRVISGVHVGRQAEERVPWWL